MESYRGRSLEPEIWKEKELDIANPDAVRNIDDLAGRKC